MDTDLTALAERIAELAAGTKLRVSLTTHMEKAAVRVFYPPYTPNQVTSDYIFNLDHIEPFVRGVLLADRAEEEFNLGHLFGEEGAHLREELLTRGYTLEGCRDSLRVSRGGLDWTIDNADELHGFVKAIRAIEPT